MTLFRIAAAAAVSLATTMSTPAVGKAASSPVGWETRTLQSITGEPVEGETFAGKVVLLVNTASRCAFTPQYEGLEALQDAYGARGLTVLGIPSNDFGGQEPGSDAEIAQFCSTTYDVSFPMLSKSPVIGANAHELFQWARQAGGRAGVPAWNFHKVLIGRDGRFVAGFPSFTKPRAGEVVSAVERALATPAF